MVRRFLPRQSSPARLRWRSAIRIGAAGRLGHRRLDLQRGRSTIGRGSTFATMPVSVTCAKGGTAPRVQRPIAPPQRNPRRGPDHQLLAATSAGVRRRRAEGPPRSEKFAPATWSAYCPAATSCLPKMRPNTGTTTGLPCGGFESR